MMENFKLNYFVPRDQSLTTSSEDHLARAMGCTHWQKLGATCHGCTLIGMLNSINKN